MNTQRIELYFGSRKVLSVGVDTILGKRHFEEIHADARFVSQVQFRFFQQAGQWMIAHEASATNATLVDGKALSTALVLNEGTRITVGNPAKGVGKFPLVVKGVSVRPKTAPTSGVESLSSDVVPTVVPMRARPAVRAVAASRAGAAPRTVPAPTPVVQFTGSAVTDEAADNVALATGPMGGVSVNELAVALKKGVGSGRSFARACYRWIAEHISYDVAMLHRGASRNKTAEEVIRDRAAICGGYANLFKELCDRVSVECKAVSGLSKGSSSSAGGSAGGYENHRWNAVKIEGAWHLLDCTWGSGNVGLSGEFERRFEPFYFAPRPEYFVCDHFPGDDNWQLLSQPISRPEFEAFVAVKPRFYELGLELKSPLSDNLSVNNSFQIEVKNPGSLALSGTLLSGTSQLEGFVFSQASADGVWCFSGNLPAAGDYDLIIMAQVSDKSHAFESVIEYNLRASAGCPGFQGFPAALQGFYDSAAFLESPLDRVLPSGESTHFRIRVPNAGTVMVVQRSSQTRLTKNGDEFSGNVTLKPGQVDLMYSGTGLLGGLLGMQLNGLLQFEAR
jgi:hypothetical protein